MKKNYEHLANKFFVAIFFIVLACYFGTEKKYVGYVAVSLFSVNNLSIANSVLPEQCHISPSRKLYTFPESAKLEEIIQPESNQPIPLIDRLAGWSRELNIIFNTANSHFQFLLGKQAIEYKAVTVVIDKELSQSWLANGFFKYTSDNRNEEVVAFLHSFSAAMSQQDTPVLYIDRPQKLNYLKFAPHLQWAVDRETSLATMVTNELSANIDLMQVRDYLTPHDRELFYDTDHHWRTSTMFKSFVNIAKHLEQKYNIASHPQHLNPDSYKHITLPEIFLGASGRRIGTIYSKKDDFLLLDPTFSTAFEFNRPSKKIQRKGDFAQTFYDLNYLPPRHTYLSDNTYGTYLGEEADISIIKNTQSNNEFKLLIVADSFGNSIAPFLSLLFRETHILDCRAFKGTLSDYAREFEPTLIIFFLTPDILYSQLDLKDTRSEAPSHERAR